MTGLMEVSAHQRFSKATWKAGERLNLSCVTPSGSDGKIQTLFKVSDWLRFPNPPTVCAEVSPWGDSIVAPRE